MFQGIDAFNQRVVEAIALRPSAEPAWEAIRSGVLDTIRTSEELLESKEFPFDWYLKRKRCAPVTPRRWIAGGARLPNDSCTGFREEAWNRADRTHSSVPPSSESSVARAPVRSTEFVP